jgi:hypothetical protein
MSKRRDGTIERAPRLVSGETRVRLGNRLPPDIKEGLREIARLEGKSMSWVVEEVIIRYFRLPRPRYRQPQRTARPQRK